MRINVVVLTLLSSSLLLAGMPDQDANVSRLRNMYKNGKTQFSADELLEGQTWHCKEYWAIRDDFTVAENVTFYFDSIPGDNSFANSGRYGGSPCRSVTFRPTHNGIEAYTVNCQVNQPFIHSLRVSQEGDLIVEAQYQGEKVFYNAPRSISYDNENVRAVTYTHCPKAEVN